MRPAAWAGCMCLLAAAAQAQPPLAAPAPAPAAAQTIATPRQFVVCVAEGAMPLANCQIGNSSAGSFIGGCGGRAQQACGGHAWAELTGWPRLRKLASPAGYEIEVWRLMAAQLDPPLVERPPATVPGYPSFTFRCEGERERGVALSPCMQTPGLPRDA